MESIETTTGISGLDKMIAKAPFSTAAALFVGIEVGKTNEEIGSKIQAFIKSSIPEFFEQAQPEKLNSGEALDTDCDVLPAIQWLRFLDGFKATTEMS